MTDPCRAPAVVLRAFAFTGQWAVWVVRVCLIR